MKQVLERWSEREKEQLSHTIPPSLFPKDQKEQDFPMLVSSPRNPFPVVEFQGFSIFGQSH